jgi:hypothetical protein
MKNQITQLSGVVAVALALVASANAAVKLSDTLSVSGYGAGSYQFENDEGSSFDSLDIDAALVDFDFKKDKVSAKIGFFYTPSAEDDVTILDANFTYDLGRGHSVTAGKYLSWLGYESFHVPSRTFITPHYTTANIPGYRTGVKYTFDSAAWHGGVALSDSEITGLRGDGELRDSVGAEAFVSFTGIKNLTVFAGYGYETQGTFGSGDFSVANLWASYNLSEKLSVAAEYVYWNYDAAVLGLELHPWLAEVKYKVNAKLAVAARVNGVEIGSNGAHGYQVSIAPSYKLADNLELRGEIGNLWAEGRTDSQSFNAAVQAVFTF